MSVAESACARGTPVGWVAFLRIVLTAPRGAVDGNAVAKGVRKIRMAWSQCRESQCACVHRSDGAAVETFDINIDISCIVLIHPVGL